MQSFVDDLLDYARVGTTALRDPVDLREVLADVCDLLGADIERSGAQLDVGELPTVVGDTVQLRQLFLNTVGNAIKFRRADLVPTVRVSAERAADRWTVAVEDN